jgi:hypothetical protein
MLPIEKHVRWLPWLSAALLLSLAGLAHGYTADDAFITGRYAERLAGGLGYTFREGPATDGVTGPLWLFIETLFAWLGADPVDASKVLGALSTAFAVALVMRRIESQTLGRTARFIFLAFVPLSILLATNAQSGLETGFATLVFTLAWLEAASPKPRTWLLALTLFAMPWLRPECVPAAFTVLGLFLVRQRTNQARITVASVALLGLVSVAVFRIALFGSALPLSAQAKPADFANGLNYALASLSVAFGVLLLPVLVSARRNTRHAWLAATLAVHTLAVVLAGGDWMPGARLFMPMAPLVLYLAALGATRLALRPKRNLRIAGALLFALALTPQLMLGLDAIEESQSVAQSRATGGAALRDYLRTHAHSVALIDIGFLSYESDFDVLDLAGVTDPTIGLREGAHCAKYVSIDELRARGVDTLVVHSSVEPRIDDAGHVRHIAAHPTEMRLLSQPETAEHFVATEVVLYAPHYWYVVLHVRRSEVRSD